MYNTVFSKTVTLANEIWPVPLNGATEHTACPLSQATEHAEKQRSRRSRGEEVGEAYRHCSE